MTKTNNTIYTIGGVKNDGKSTLGLFLMERINKPTIIIDVAKQFQEDRAYRIIIKGIANLRYYLFNAYTKRAFYKGKLQIVFRPLQEDYIKEIEAVVKMLHDFKDIVIFFEEMELYADKYLTKKSSIFQLTYLSRNQNIDLICVIKQIKNLSDLIRDATDIFFLGNIKSPHARKYFDERSNGAYTLRAKHLKYREFLVTDLEGYWTTIQLKKQIVNIIN